MTPDRRSQDPQRPEDQDLDGERVCAELQAQIAHAHAFMDQSRRLFRAAALEPRSFRRDDD